MTALFQKSQIIFFLASLTASSGTNAAIFKLMEPWVVVEAQLCKAVASDTRDPRLESHHWRMHNQNTEKTKIRKKRPEMGHL